MQLVIFEMHFWYLCGFWLYVFLTCFCFWIYFVSFVCCFRVHLHITVILVLSKTSWYDKCYDYWYIFSSQWLKLKSTKTKWAKTQEVLKCSVSSKTSNKWFFIFFVNFKRYFWYIFERDCNCSLCTFSHYSGHQFLLNGEQCESYKYHKCHTDCYLYAV